ncbi:sulfite exporter TauE/SafE family protein [Thiohalorhabdus methylotrophus]|uniref:Sulfite exporter TauE/SafE family protein n=1 Tax=Thiohalorhabdus methylotrophus TaxID=3242694 RepID=A0ABV4TT53_9GAMM
MEALTLSAAFVVGLLGGPHCAAMCGGITATLTFGLDARIRTSLWRQLPFLLAYNLGRIASYTAAGAGAGALGTALALGAPHALGPLILRGLAGLLMVALGLYIGGWWPAFSRVERIGMPLWRRLEPLGQRLLPVRGVGTALGLGAVWGWLPCGMVYMVLIQALTAGGAAHGALLMLAFGLGTLPNLLAMGMFAAVLGSWLGDHRVRRAAGILLIGFGLWALWMAVAGGH